METKIKEKVSKFEKVRTYEFSNFSNEREGKGKEKYFQNKNS